MLTYFEGRYELVIMFIISGVALAAFLVSYLYERRRVLIGFLFNLFLLCIVGIISFTAVTSSNIFLSLLSTVFLVGIIGILVFGIYILIVALFMNARIVMKKERRSVANLLTFFLGILLMVYVILDMIQINRFFSSDINMFLNGIHVVVFYYMIDLCSFLTAALIYQFNKPQLNQDFIIVLGSKLMGDRVPPLLGSRIDRAIAFYHKQSKVGKCPKIIFSGGQGSDEEISEALGMQSYAVEKGIPIEHTILEDGSVSTLQNMTLSKDIMDRLMPNGYKSIFVTNNYHLFRAGIYARLAGLKSQGLGAKTALYFLPNAIIREYIAIVVMYKKRHIIMVSLILINAFILAILPYILKMLE